MWVYYSSKMNDLPMIVRSSIELTLLSISAVYIVRNKMMTIGEAQISPLPVYEKQNA
jgi:hypothetical protein